MARWATCTARTGQGLWRISLSKAVPEKCAEFALCAHFLRNTFRCLVVWIDKQISEEKRLMRSVKISSIAMHHPAKKITNADFDKAHNTQVDAFLRNTRNIFQRYHMAPDECTSDLILPAAKKAMAKAGVVAADLDLIIIATDTPDYISPSTASVVQFQLGAKNAAVFDLNTACTGFVAATDTACKFIQADKHYNCILVVGAYAMSKHLDYADYKIASMFADGAGAAILQPTTNADQSILASYFWADGSYNQAMGIYAGGSVKPFSAEVLQTKEHLLKFKVKVPPEFNSTHWPRIAHRLLDQIGATPQEVSRFFFTQINIEAIRQSMDALGVDRTKAHTIMDRYGYTGSACIPMALADAEEQGLLEPGDLVLLIASGGGFSMGGLALRWAGEKNSVPGLRRNGDF